MKKLFKLKAINSLNAQNVLSTKNCVFSYDNNTKFGVVTNVQSDLNLINYRNIIIKSKTFNIFKITIVLFLNITIR